MQYAADVLLSREFAKDVRLYNIYSFISQKFLNTWKVLFSKKEKISSVYKTSGTPQQCLKLLQQRSLFY